MELAKDKNKFKFMNIAMLCTHGINNIVSIFVSTFLVSYIYSISNNYIKDIGLFYAFVYLSMIVFYTLISKLIDKTDRVSFYRVGIVVESIFIVCVIFLGRELARFVVLAGALYGFAEACYWASYNLMKNELVSKHTIEKYSLFQFIDKKAITIIIPLILGKIIDGESFKISAVIVLILVAIQLVLTIFIKSKRPENSHFSFKEFIGDAKKLDKKQLEVLKLSYFSGVLYGMTRLVSPLNTIMIMIFFGSNFSLGVFTSIFAVAEMLLLMFYKKFTKFGERNIFYILSATLPMVVVSIMIFKMSKATLILYTLFYMLSIVLFEFSFDVMRNQMMKKFNMYDSIAEYQCSVEASLQVGRIITFLLVALVGALTAGVGSANLQTVLKIMSFVSIFVVSLTIISVCVLENKFKKCAIKND